MGNPSLNDTFCESGRLEDVVGFLRDTLRDSGRYAQLKGYAPFLALYNAGMLEEGVVVRRQQARGPADDTYQLTDDGKLEGMNVQMYPGFPGRHVPESLLALEVNEQGWILSPMAVGKIINKLDSE